MRYSVIFVEKLAKWAVVDTMSTGFTLDLHEKEKDAEDAASSEEKRWRSCLAAASAALH